jgi:hypothetical protein
MYCFMQFQPPFAAIRMLSMSRVDATASGSYLFEVGPGHLLHRPHHRLIHHFS